MEAYEIEAHSMIALGKFMLDNKMNTDVATDDKNLTAIKPYLEAEGLTDAIMRDFMSR